ncbi:MAG: MarR family winged helix-turn-helix transcriptional regulator [Solirubrobacteraceae bacterium]
MGAQRQPSGLHGSLLSLVRGIDRVHSSGALVAHSGVEFERALHPVLMTIGKLEPIRMTDLALALALERSTVSRQATRLEELGFVRRIAARDDARASLLEISPEGRIVLGRLYEAWDEILAQQLALFGCADPEALTPQVSLLADALALLPLRDGGDERPPPRRRSRP